MLGVETPASYLGLSKINSMSNFGTHLDITIVGTAVKNNSALSAYLTAG